MKTLKLTKLPPKAMAKVKGGNVPPTCAGCLCNGSDLQACIDTDAAGSSKK